MTATIVRSPLFQGLTPSQLDDIVSLMRPARFQPGDAICRAGEPGDTLYVVERGLAHVIPPGGESLAPVARLRRGDVIGEMSLVTGEPRSATVIAALATDTLQLDQARFAELLLRYPVVLANLNRILSERLARTTVRHTQHERGEAIALLVDEEARGILSRIVAAATSASPRPVSHLDIGDPSGLSLDAVLGRLDDLLASDGTVLVTAPMGGQDALVLADQVDRVVAIGNEQALAALAVPQSERVLVGAPGPLRTKIGPMVRTIATDDAGPDIAWLGRHLSRTKLGLALGAGGAKGYAHIAAIGVLEAAGYTIDYVSGSSIGAFVGAWLALGQRAAQLESTMRHAFSPEVVAAMFTLSLSGMSTGLDEVTRVCKETTEGQTFTDLTLPLIVMCVDLVTREPAPITQGPLWEALLAAIALAGLFPPYQRNGQRLVDGLALVPVPTGSVVEAGADISISCNIMSRDTLSEWPGEQPPEEQSPAKGRVRMLDTLLEVMDLSQLDSSTRHAAQADVVITPRFGPSTWRDFHLADRFIEAGHLAAQEQLPALRSLAVPQERT